MVPNIFISVFKEQNVNSIYTIILSNHTANGSWGLKWAILYIKSITSSATHTWLLGNVVSASLWQPGDPPNRWLGPRRPHVPLSATAGWSLCTYQTTAPLQTCLAGRWKRKAESDWGEHLLDALTFLVSVPRGCAPFSIYFPSSDTRLWPGCTQVWSNTPLQEFVPD